MSKNPYDLGSQIRFRILPKKRTLTLWLTRCLKSPKRLFLIYVEWFRSGIIQVRELLIDENSFLSIQECKAKFKFKPRPLTYCGIISKLKTVKKSLKSNPTESMKNEPMTSKLEKAKNASQLVYMVVVEKKALHLPKVKKNGGRIEIVLRKT